MEAVSHSAAESCSKQAAGDVHKWNLKSRAAFLTCCRPQKGKVKMEDKEAWEAASDNSLFRLSLDICEAAELFDLRAAYWTCLLFCEVAVSLGLCSTILKGKVSFDISVWTRRSLQHKTTSKAADTKLFT